MIYYGYCRLLYVAAIISQLKHEENVYIYLKKPSNCTYINLLISHRNLVANFSFFFLAVLKYNKTF